MAILLAILLTACDSGGTAAQPATSSPSPGAAVSQLGPRLDAGLGYRQDESGVIVVHLRGSASQMSQQAGVLLANEIAAYKTATARNPQTADASAGSGYAAWGAGQLWSGVTFDSSGLGAQDRYRVVYIVQPSGGIPFVSVSWPATDGALSVRSAMNAAGISLSYFHVPANGESAAGNRALWQTLASVAARARTIDQAVAMLSAVPRTTSANILIGDGMRQHAVVVELAPHSLAVRQPSTSAIWTTDHFASAKSGGATRNESSVARFQRLGTLVGDGTRRLTPALAVALLRDHFDQRTGRSNLSGEVIAAYTNVLAEVYNPTRGTFWVATGTAPAVYGAWAGFNLSEEVAGQPSAARVMALPTDPVLSTADNAGFRSFEQGYVAYLQRDLPTATASLGAAVQSEPKNGTYRLIFGLALSAADKDEAAVAAFRAAIAAGLDALQRAIAYDKLGAIYQSLGQRRQSLDAYRAVLALKTGDAALEAAARAALARPPAASTPTPTPTPKKATPSETPTDKQTPTPTPTPKPSSE